VVIEQDLQQDRGTRRPAAPVRQANARVGPTSMLAEDG